MKNKILLVFILLGSVAFFTQDLSRHGVEYRDDEIFYYNSTREMVETGNYLSPTYFGENRFQKPILFYWLIVLSYKIFGVNWFAARFVAAVFAGLTVCLTWLMARDLFDKNTAHLSVPVLMTIPLFFRHAKNAVPDMALNFFIVGAVYCAVKSIQDPSRNKFRYLFFAACGLGFMIKGFAALVVPASTLIVYALAVKRRDILAKMDFPSGILILAAIILPWFLYMVKLHGPGYLDYMLKAETLNRMVSHDRQNGIIKFLMTFRNNSLFYLQTLLSYFAPWSLFAVFAIPWSLNIARRQQPKRESHALMNVWFFVVFFFFSSIFARINHLILVLSTPFAILISSFLLTDFDYATLKGKVIRVVRKSALVFILALGVLGLCLLRFFLIGSGKLWIIGLGIFLFAASVIIIRSRNVAVGSWVLAVFILFVYSQAGLASRAGLTPHSTHQRIAQVIKEDSDKDSVIGVGSHDIHEKEFQVYFDKRVEKAATSDDEETKRRLSGLFASHGKVYCLMIEKDYERLLKNSGRTDIKVIQEDYIARKRLYIDRGFFIALLHFEQKKVRDYIMEKVILLKKEPT